MPGKPKSERVYLPFQGWLFTGPIEYNGFAQTPPGYPHVHKPRLEVGRIERTEGAVASTGLLYHRDPITALQCNGGLYVTRLELVGPCNEYATGCFAKQRTALWEAKCSHALHLWAIWLAKDYAGRLKTEHARKRMYAAIGNKTAALDHMDNKGCRTVGECEPTWGGNKVIDALRSPWPRACALDTYEAVRASYDRNTFGDFWRRAAAELERLLLLLEEQQVRPEIRMVGCSENLNDAYRAQWLKEVIGHTEEDVREAVAAGGGTLRVTRRDKTHYAGTRDVKPDRVNVEVEEGKVVSAHYG